MRRRDLSFGMACVQMALEFRAQDLLAALVSKVPAVEHIGAADCPLMDRWTLWESDRFDCKLLLHHFLPWASDPDCHDHPRPFVTVVLRGRYEDIVPCPECSRDPGWSQRGSYRALRPCERCSGHGKVVGETMTAGKIRRRRARHAHLTRTDGRGAWTLVLMGPKRRPWGFLRKGRWWQFRDYESEFGFHMRCESESGELLRGREASMADIARASDALGDVERFEGAPDDAWLGARMTDGETRYTIEYGPFGRVQVLESAACSRGEILVADLGAMGFDGEGVVVPPLTVYRLIHGDRWPFECEYTLGAAELRREQRRKARL